MTEQTRYEVRAAALALRAALLTADGDAAEAAKEARDKLPELRAAVDAVLDAALDPDPPEPPLPELLPDVATVDALLNADDPVTWFNRRADELGGGASEAVALRRVLAAADRGETAPTDLVKLAERDLARRERSARRLVRMAQLEADAAAANGESGENLRKQLRAARTALTEARIMRRKVAGARVGATPVAVPDVPEARPARLLSAAGKGGALLTAGNLLVLAGEGGIAKSPLSLAVALGMADRHARREHGAGLTGAAIEASGYGDLHGGLFEGAGGPALIVTYEDTAGDVAYRLRTLAATWWPTGDRARAALANVRVLAGVGPLFGPAPSQDGEGPAFYNARPGPLDGWADLWRGAAGIDGLRLVVIDPAMAAYVGNANDPGPVRELYGALAERAAALQLGVLLVAHTNKASRRPGGRKTEKPDVYDPGAVSGSTHWTDAARGALHLAYDPDDDTSGARVLAVPKANYGPQKMRVNVDPVRDNHGEICGFGAGGAWQTNAEHKAEAEANGKVDPAPVPADGDTLDVF